MPMNAPHLNEREVLLSAERLWKIPAELRNQDCWVWWKFEQRDGKATKVPSDVRGIPVDVAKNPRPVSFSQAVKGYVENNSRLAGIGFVFTSDNPFCGVDIDDCIVNGELSPKAREIVQELASYTEISPSGTGVKIFLKGKLPGKRRRRDNVEMYDAGRFFTVTGKVLAGVPVEVHERQEQLTSLYYKIFEHDDPAVNHGAESSSDYSKWRAVTDSEIVQQLLSNPAYAKLWNGDVSGQNGDQSAADFKLCCRLVYFTGGDIDRVDRLFRQSRLMRAKWDERRGEGTYGQITIASAVCKEKDRWEPPRISQGIVLRDLPETALDGRLGELCEKRLSGFPRAYSYPSLLAAASVLIDRRAAHTRTNLYVGLVGPVHSGKSQSIDRACEILGVRAPVLMQVLSGSAEQLVRETKDAGGAARLFSPDELGHTLEKMRIERSSFSFVLNSAYYKDSFKVLLGKKETVLFDCVLSIVGGLVDDRFQELFSATTCMGLYDRFTFGLCPTGFQYDYFPYAGVPADVAPVAIGIDPGVWDLRKEWLQKNPDFNARVIEHGIRAAIVCASIDGRNLLRAEDLGPCLEMIRYQHRIRNVLKPNSGETVEGRLANKILTYLASTDGEFVNCRDMFRALHAYDAGPRVAAHIVNALVTNGDITTSKIGKKIFVRLVSDAELDQE